MSTTTDAEAAALPHTLQSAYPEVYQELKAMAHRALARQPAGATLGTTALVHEAFLKLAPRAERVSTQDRSRFFGLCACAMRHIVIDHARARRSRPAAAPAFLPEQIDSISDGGDDPHSLLAIERAMVELEALDPRLVRVIDLHVFAGLELREVGELLDLSLRSVQRDFKRARAWLAEALRGED